MTAYRCLNCGEAHERGKACPLIARRERRYKALCEVRPHFNGAGFDEYVWNQTRNDLWAEWVAKEPRLAELAPDEAREAEARRVAAE